LPKRLKPPLSDADISRVMAKLKLSRQMKIVAAAVAVLLVGVIALKMLTGGTPAEVVIPPPVVHKTPAQTAKTAKAAKHKALPKIDSTLPAPLRRELARHGLVVAVLYAPEVAGDDDAVRAAREGAHAAHAGFTALNVRNEAVAAALALKLPGSSDPAVVIVRRPGDIALVLNGYHDAEVVAQAARAAK
jgi:hypothetical protein